MARMATGLLAMVFAAITIASPLRAQGLIRDPEIEYALQQLSAPIARAAGMGAGKVRILMVNDSSLNAFVANANTIVLHTGLPLKLKTAEQVQAVLAHEFAHITNGHITRRATNARSARNSALAGLAASLALAAGGAGQAALGVAAGTNSAAQRSFFAHTRAEEAAADQTGARYMARAGIEPQAMAEVLQIFRGQEALSVSRQDPYVRTHPLTSDRLRAVKGYAAAYPADGAPDANTAYWFARARGKLSAFLRNPSYTLRRIPKGDTSDAALIQRAVAYHRQPDAAAAIREIDKLAARRANDPFVHELRGQILLESRNFPAAVAAYRRAVQLAPQNAQMQAGYGRALLAQNTAASNKKALTALEGARGRDAADPRMLRDLSVAYARAGQNGMASVATAERYALLGRLSDAVLHAQRAQGLLARGSRGWLRADDILAAAKRAGR